MTEITEMGPAASRVMRSARVLKAYFEHKLKMQLELLTEAPNEPLIEGVQFNLQIGSWGIWGLRSSEPLNEKTQSEISASFHSLLGAMDEIEKRQFDLVRLEEKYQIATSDLPSNVIPMRRPRLARPFAASRDKRWVLRQDCLIESTDLADIHKMALELHAHSQRYAFVNYSDLDKQSRLNLSELKELSAVTLFVGDIMQLKIEEQEVLHQLASSTSAIDRPLLIVGAPQPYSDLRTEPAIHLEFLLLLSRAYIKLTRPFSEYKDKGLIHYFLDSLAQNPS